MKENSIPKYQEIINSIEEKIRNDVYQKGSLIPTEQEMCKQFDTSRMTVRRAIDELVKKGWLYRIQGRGTFISHLEIDKSYSMCGFTQNMIELGFKPSSEVTKFQIINPDEQISKALKLLSTNNVYILERIRMADNEPIAIERAYLPEKLFPGLLEYSFETNSLYEILRRYYNVEIAYSQQKVNAISIKGEEAKILFNRSQGVVLKMKNTVFDKNMNPIEYADSIYHGTKYPFNIIIKNEK